MRSFIKRYKIEFAIFFLAVIVRLGFFFVCLLAHGGDLISTIRGQDWYFEVSRNLLLNGFSAETVAPFTPYSYGVPLYPYFLFGLLWFTKSYAAVAMIQLLLSATIPLLGMWLARLIIPKESSFKKVTLIVGILLALAPYQVLHSFIFFTETVFTVLFILFLIVFFRYLKEPSGRSIALAAFLLGLATLTKATVQYVPILVAVFMFWRLGMAGLKKFSVHFGYFALIFFIVLSPWLYRNYHTFGVFNISAQVSMNMYVTLLPSVLAIDNNTSFVEEQGKLPSTENKTLFEVGALAKGQILEHKIALVKLCMISAFTFFTHDGMLTFMQNAGITPSTYLKGPAVLLLLKNPAEFISTAWSYMHTNLAVVLFARAFWMVTTIFFFFGLYRLFRYRALSPFMVFAVVMVFYFMLTTMINGLTVNARFRMPIEPIIFAVAAVGFVPLYDLIKKKIS